MEQDPIHRHKDVLSHTIAVVENGAWPMSLPDYYPVDVAHLAEYARLAKTAEGFARYCDAYVYGKKAA